MTNGLDRGGPLAVDHSSAGGRLVGVDGRTLPLQGIAVRADASGGLARVVLQQRFHNPHGDPLRVTYQMPLPPEAAVSGYAFQIGPRRVVGEVDRAEAARDRFEQALVEGRTAGLLEQERSSFFSQEIGNIPAGVEVTAGLVIDQRLRWLEEGAWEWRFPTVIAPRYLGERGRVDDHARIAVDVADAPLRVSADLALTIRDPLGVESPGAEPRSPSHQIAIRTVAGSTEVRLADDGDRALDRDVVVRWPAASRATAVALDTGRPSSGRAALTGSAYGLLTITPPRPDSRGVALARDLIVLLDMSGSMSGRPLDQARQVVGALIETLGADDQLELIGFASQPTRWKSRPVKVTAAVRQEALAWLQRLQAGGGTEMRSGVTEALRPLRAEAQRQVVLVTDGEIGFESEIVGLILRDLPAGCRLHTVGVGPAVNRTLTGGAARAGRGAEIVVGLDEDPAGAIARLLARLEAPLLTDVTVTGSALLDQVPARPADVCAAAPLLVALRLRPDGGDLLVAGRLAGQPWRQPLGVEPIEAGAGTSALATLYAREVVEDLEMRRAADGTGRLDGQIERTGLDFQIATRLTSWVAVAEEPTVDPGQPTRRERIPQMVPQGLSVEGLGILPSVPVVQELRSSFVGQRVVARMAQSVSVLARLAPPPPPPVELAGRIALRRDRDLVIEIPVADPLDWKVSRRVVLVWKDRMRASARVDTTATTRPGEIGAGQVVRLVLRLRKDAPDAPPVKVLLNGGAIVVTLDGAP
ncbi:MAG TPA: VIT domain-containing protein [Methylomirabilota bacterium]|jgi:Ca-activated chloride channel family protein